MLSVRQPCAGSKPVLVQVLYMLALAACILVYLKNYWLAEDSYINFRSLDQLWAGRGPVWNPGERVQVYTSALWYWLVAAAKVIVRDNYLATFFCSFVLYLLVLLQAVRLQASHLAAAVVIGLLLSSNSFMDFSSSGLENVLIYFLLLLFFGATVKRSTTGSLQPYVLAALLLTARHDLAVLILPVCLWVWCTDWQYGGLRKAMGNAVLGGLPFIAWEIFSIVYYGFPFPNTAYAKLSSGIPQDELVQQGFNYLFMSLTYDPVLATVGVLGLASGFLFPCTRWWAAGVVLNVVYVVYVGGDYMRGRFFSYAYLLCALMLVYGFSRLPGRAAAVALAAIFCCLLPYHVMQPVTPVTSTTAFSDHIKKLETANERGLFYNSTSLVQYFSTAERREPFPTWPFYIEGLRLKTEHREPWIFITNVGMTGYAIGIDMHIFDQLALTDPLLARLPSPHCSWTPGHFPRELPWGYVDANLYGNQPIHDPDLDRYYSQLRLITRSPDLFSAERLKAIVRMNLFPPSHLLRTHIEKWKLRTCTACKK